MNNDTAINILAQILVDNGGQRLTHALSTGIVSAFAQSLAAVPPDLTDALEQAPVVAEQAPSVA